LDFNSHIVLPTPLQKLQSPIFDEKNIEVWVKRDDETHPAISGNKFRKLKYNLIKAEKLNKNKLLTFGGAFSNHIYALAAAANIFNFESVGIIRGDELNKESSPTLKFSSESGMKMHFLTRNAYRDKEALRGQFEDKNTYFIPEGGSNAEALKGCAEMLDEVLKEISPTHFCLAAGTGGTTAGVLSNANYKGKTYCFPVLKKGGFIKDEIEALITLEKDGKLHLFLDYHFGGYAKKTQKLLAFMHTFETQYLFKLDQVYTAKLFFGVFDLISKNHFPPNSKIVIYHSGGLQGRLSNANK
jgi:1-aminocyclopropane-1-carboxylate deaminase